MNNDVLNQNIDETLREHILENVESSEVVLDEELIEVESTENYDSFVDPVETILEDSIEYEEIEEVII